MACPPSPADTPHPSSQAAGLLCASGPVTRERSGRSVLYRRTAVGDVLVGTG
ncbi:hypothetical protein [Actinomadura sp. KC345]|uniref:hypothetical protein n=1 Tax=Actinomadura sp. KC345 TaxID=2530371 RepID=UPI001405536C|nr:hypothetical protein [Actinomadura sp. KC345]